VIERLFEPAWAGGWAWMRRCWALAALACVLPRFGSVEDAYAASDMIFSRGPWFLADHVVLGPAAVYGLLAGCALCLVAVARGGRLFVPCLLLFLLMNWTVLSAEALSIKGSDRLLTQTGLVLLFSPAREKDLRNAWRSETARWFLLVVYMALYGSTGWLKLLKEPAWWSGKVLANHLVHPWFGSRPLGVWVSAQPWLTIPMSWTTVLAEALFPLLVFFRRTNPWILALLAGMHLGILLLMDLWRFSLVSVAGYPVLLHPGIAREIQLRWQAWRQSRRGSEDRPAPGVAGVGIPDAPGRSFLASTGRGGYPTAAASRTRARRPSHLPRRNRCPRRTPSDASPEPRATSPRARWWTPSTARSRSSARS